MLEARVTAQDICAGVVCTALDSCHEVGTCDPLTGTCTNPPKAPGGACSDGNACTGGDTCTLIPCTDTGSVLWLGHDGASNFTKVLASDGTLLQTNDIAGTGTAWNGANLFFSSTGGVIHQRQPDGITDVAVYSTTAFGSPTEDLTWDTTRQRLWRVDHNPPTLVRIDPVTQMVDANYPLSTSDADPNIVPRGALGIAYDTLRDVLYVSFCRAGCSSNTIGEVVIVNPATGAETGSLFYTHGFMTGGLAYDPVGDTVWVGSNDGLHHMTRFGVDLVVLPVSEAGFLDGVEFIPACSAAQVQCVGSAVVCDPQNSDHCDTATGCACGNGPACGGATPLCSAGLCIAITPTPTPTNTQTQTATPTQVPPATPTRTPTSRGAPTAAAPTLTPLMIVALATSLAVVGLRSVLRRSNR